MWMVWIVGMDPEAVWHMFHLAHDHPAALASWGFFFFPFCPL